MKTGKGNSKIANCFIEAVNNIYENLSVIPFFWNAKNNEWLFTYKCTSSLKFFFVEKYYIISMNFLNQEDAKKILAILNTYHPIELNFRVSSV